MGQGRRKGRPPIPPATSRPLGGGVQELTPFLLSYFAKAELGSHPLSYLTTLCRIFLSSWSRHTAKGQLLDPIICTLFTLICDVLIWKEGPGQPPEPWPQSSQPLAVPSSLPWNGPTRPGGWEQEFAWQHSKAKGQFQGGVLRTPSGPGSSPASALS